MWQLYTKWPLIEEWTRQPPLINLALFCRNIYNLNTKSLNCVESDGDSGIGADTQEEEEEVPPPAPRDILLAAANNDERNTFTDYRQRLEKR